MGTKVSDLWERLILFQDKMEKIAETIDNHFNSCYLILPSDILEYEEYILIKIDVPGIDENNLQIALEENFLIVEGNKTKDFSEKEGKYLIAERRFGKFKNIIQIPKNFDTKEISYYIKDGVLIIKINKD